MSREQRPRRQGGKAKNPSGKDAMGVTLDEHALQVDPEQYKLLVAALTYGPTGILEGKSYAMDMFAGQSTGLPMPDAMNANFGALSWQWQGYMEPSPAYPMIGSPLMSYMDPFAEQFLTAGSRKGSRDRNEHGNRTNGKTRTDSAAMIIAQEPGPVTFTTVMFRNIPNKYTCEMLVKQLDEVLKGQFDFVYMPIDFQRECNVGYAFINFRTTESCESFVKQFHGIEASKCLPGINSHKVAEVTPARVQGLEDNVKRLRNSPVMLELGNHPDWMPLLFDENGNQMPFPAPERTLEPFKPRKGSRGLE